MLDSAKKSVIIHFVAARNDNKCHGEMAELVEGARLEIV